MKLLLLADDSVGLEISTWLLNTHREDIALIVTLAENEIFSAAKSANVRCVVAESSEQVLEYVETQKLQFDLGLLVWWPKIIKGDLLKLPSLGFINTHPSFLPYNRGKHYNFWALVEQSPFGVSLHFVTEGIDSGDIVAQESIPYTWEDNGASLYFKAREAMVRLFIKTYPILQTLNIPRYPQKLEQGSVHFAKELEAASQIDLDQRYLARDLLNLLRARTFSGHPACRFVEGDDQYEIRVEIIRKN